MNQSEPVFNSRCYIGENSQQHRGSVLSVRSLKCNSYLIKSEESYRVTTCSVPSDPSTYSYSPHLLQALECRTVLYCSFFPTHRAGSWTSVRTEVHVSTFNVGFPL